MIWRSFVPISPKLGIVEQHTSVGTGKSMWVETGKTPVHNDQGEVIGVLAFGVDVTERKQAEEILHRSAEQQQQTSLQLRAALEAASELIQIQDLDTLYRRTVELAREKFDIERCGLYMVDESREQMWGTYGTDDQRQTTDERGSQRTTDEFAEILTASPQAARGSCAKHRTFTWKMACNTSWALAGWREQCCGARPGRSGFCSTTAP